MNEYELTNHEMNLERKFFAKKKKKKKIQVNSLKLK